MKKVFLAIAFLPFFFSCEREELPVPPHDPGNVITATVNMEMNYRWQFYYDLGTNSVVGQNLKSTWDLGFETSASGYRVILNTAKAMFAWNTGDTNFVAVNDTTGFTANRRWDEPSGNLDSTAIGNWTNSHPVYILDRGYNENGAFQGMRKMKIESVNASGYTIRFSEMNGNSDTTFFIPKDTLYNFTFLSFGNGGHLQQVEPPKATWDLVFTQYVHIFYNPTEPYLVTGCLLNRHNTFAARDTVNDFSVIDYSQATTHPLSPAINTIGYDWKTFVSNTYITNPGMNFIIRDHTGTYYKLHFIDFYNSNGIKGNPKWEMQQL
jgi:hypothetical protein